MDKRFKYKENENLKIKELRKITGFFSFLRGNVKSILKILDPFYQKEKELKIEDKKRFYWNRELES